MTWTRCLTSAPAASITTPKCRKCSIDLEMGDILTRSGPRSNLYRFKIDLIRRWIYATRPN